MLGRFKRSGEVPAEVRERAGLRSGEKALAGAAASDDSWLVGTRDALYVVPPDAEPSRTPWEQVERADWTQDSGRLQVVEVGEFGRVRAVHTFTLDEPGPLLPLIRERVTASVVLQRRVVLDGRRGFFVIARRPPTGSGEITWAYEFDPDVDPDDPAVQEAAELGLRAAAEELGL
jgi:hypothetical protein